MFSNQARGAAPGRQRVERLDERHADHRSDRVAGPTCPAGGLKLGDESCNLRLVQQSSKLGNRRAQWYVGYVHGANTSVGQTPGRSTVAGVAFS